MPGAASADIPYADPSTPRTDAPVAPEWLSPARCLRLLLLLVTLGAVCRVAQYASRRSFWQDEAYVILNLRAKSPAQLFGPLDARPGDPQAAPPAFLLIEKLAFDRFGPSELALRLFAQILGLLALPLIAAIAWRLLPPPGAVCALALFALSDRIIAHAAEVKQYSGDVFTTCLLLYLATRRVRLLTLLLVASVTVWFSYTTVFVTAAISLAFLVTHRPRTPRALAAFALAHVPFLLSLAAVYLTCTRHQQDPLLYNQWADFMPNWRQPHTWPLWLAKNTYDLANYAAINTGPMFLVLAGAGAIALYQRARSTPPQHAGAERTGSAREAPPRIPPRIHPAATLTLLLAPTLLCLLAACAHAYPYGGTRTSAFLAPTLCLLAGAGFAALFATPTPATAAKPTDLSAGHRSPRRYLRVTAAVLAGVSIAILATESARGLVQPRTRSHIRPAIEFLRQHRQPADTVCVVGGAASDVYRVYQDPIDPRTHLNVQPDTPLPTGRFWLLFAGSPDRREDAMKHHLTRASAAGAQLRQSKTVRGGAAFLFNSSPH